SALDGAPHCTSQDAVLISQVHLHERSEAWSDLPPRNLAGGDLEHRPRRNHRLLAQPDSPRQAPNTVIDEYEATRVCQPILMALGQFLLDRLDHLKRPEAIHPRVQFILHTVYSQEVFSHIGRENHVVLGLECLNRFLPCWRTDSKAGTAPQIDQRLSEVRHL